MTSSATDTAPMLWPISTRLQGPCAALPSTFAHSSMRKRAASPL